MDNQSKVWCPECQSAMAWIDMGPSLEYWYCRNCKRELAEIEYRIHERHFTNRETIDEFPHWPEFFDFNDSDIT